MLSINGHGPFVNLPHIEVAAVGMNQMYHIVIVDERKLVAIENLHASSFELPDGNLLLSCAKVQFLISQLEQVFDHMNDG